MNWVRIKTVLKSAQMGKRGAYKNSTDLYYQYDMCVLIAKYMRMNIDT